MKIQSTALYQEVAARLRERIYSQDLLPGLPIDEQALAEEFGISRTPMREALKVLHAEGLVVLEPRRGCFVTELDRQDIDEMFPLMAMLEGRCAYEAVRKASADDIDRIEALHRKLEDSAAAGDVEQYFALNCQFHELVQKMAKNKWLERITSDLRKFLKLMRGRQLRLPGRLQQSLTEHRMLLAAFQSHNYEAAEKIMHDHLMNQRVALLEYDARNDSEVGIG
jgi:DNA-binding GntR family transcriptional regulator